MTAASTDKLTADWLTVDTADGPMRLYRARPASQNAVAPPAAIVVLQEAFGVNEHIQDVTRRLAAQGYLALAPDLFHRTGNETVDYADRETAMSLIAELGAQPIITDVKAVLKYLDEAESISPDRTAVVGFCFGGRAAFTAATALLLAATVVFYGPGITSGPHALLDRTPNIRGPVLMFVGDTDPTIPAEHVQEIKDAATQSGVDLDVVVFAGAGHAFHCDARPAQYVAAAATEAWQQTTEFLSKHLAREE